VAVWYLVDHSGENQDRCLFLSLEKVKQWAQMQDMIWQEDGDPRALNCVEIALE
jgi:hypothetical protein